MAAASKLEQCEDVDQVRRATHDVRIGQRVMLALGKPDDLFRVQVRELWERRYRVNVYTGPDASSARVAHSYFLETDDDGEVIKSTPNLKRRYGCPADSPGPSPVGEAVIAV
jgi:hypothetical protein